MSNFLNRAMQNVDKKPEKPVSSAGPIVEHTVTINVGPFRSDMDLAKLNSEAFKEEIFKAITAVSINMAQGQTDEDKRKKVRNKVAATFKANLTAALNECYQALRQMDPELESDLQNALSGASDSGNPL